MVQRDRQLLQVGRFERSKSEPTLYVKKRGPASILIISLYVDDMVITGNDETKISQFKDEMKKRYEMSDLGLLHHFLGIEISQEERGVFICQTKYAKDLLEKFKMNECNPVQTPLQVN